MLSKSFENEILKNLNLLEKDQQNRVLNYIKSLLKNSKGTQIDLLKFAGSFDPKEIQQISKAIEDDCENIDKNEW
ncbi:MAG: hypothetical protein ACK4ND_15045 [Cytophagaceae bacterium]